MTGDLGPLIGREVRRLRELRGWSGEYTARRLTEIGLPWSRSRLVDLETGRRRDLNLGEVLLIAECFDVSPADLLPRAGQVFLGKAFRPARVLRSMLTGDRAPNADLLGPQDRPDWESQLTGKGPFWSRPGDREMQFYPAFEVELARRAGADVAVVHEFAMYRQLGPLAQEQLPGLVDDLTEWLVQHGHRD